MRRGFNTSAQSANVCLPKQACNLVNPAAHGFDRGASACSFEDYKKNEKKEVKVDEILGADVARKAVSDAMVSIVL
jgi:hypothetical protein